MPLRLSIERKDAEVDCMRFGGVNKSALLSFEENGMSVDEGRFRSVKYLPRTLALARLSSSV